MTATLEAVDLTAGYGKVAAVHELDFSVSPGEIVALLGPNGAGKSTTLLALVGELPLLAGSVLRHGSPATGPLHRRAKAGVAFLAGENAVFTGLSVEQNLNLGMGTVADALELFPELKPLLARRAGLLSGGEQQMLAVARALTSGADTLLVDELSLGLAPLVVRRLLARIQAAARDGMAVVLVEQAVPLALEVADRGYVLRRGRCELSDSAANLRANMTAIEALYLP